MSVLFYFLLCIVNIWNFQMLKLRFEMLLSGIFSYATSVYFFFQGLLLFFSCVTQSGKLYVELFASSNLKTFFFQHITSIDFVFILEKKCLPYPGFWNVILVQDTVVITKLFLKNHSFCILCFIYSWPVLFILYWKCFPETLPLRAEMQRRWGNYSLLSQ